MGRLTSDVTTSPSGTITASQSYGYDPNGYLTSQVSGGQLAESSGRTADVICSCLQDAGMV
jgi:uncharacterized protein RhaS with RHS repeats